MPLPHKLPGPTAQRSKHDKSGCQVSVAFEFNLLLNVFGSWVLTRLILARLQNHHFEHGGWELFCVHVTLQRQSV